MSRQQILNYLKLVQTCRQYSVLSDKASKLLKYSPVTSVSQRNFLFERDKKGGYGSEDKISTLQHMKNGFKELKYELKLWQSEMKEMLAIDPLLIARPGEIDLVWLFNEPKVLEKFVTTSDSDHNEGFSTCKFEMSKAGRARFHGYLDVRTPKDGRVKKAGYCSMRSMRVRKSFKRESTFDWHLYNTLVLKVRGDGRSYLLNLSCEGFYDITWNDIYHYVLYTRGGPYWQIAKGASEQTDCLMASNYRRPWRPATPEELQIPFSKFVMGSKGRLQDKQVRIRLDRITHFGITAGDKITGPFDLEIEYVGLEFDPTHDEDFAYELYKTEKHIVGV